MAVRSGMVNSVWEKKLWQRQPFPDNYTDETFLQGLVVNADPPQRSYWGAVVDAASVSQQLCVVTACAVVPLHLRSHTLQAETLLAVDAVLLCLGFTVCAALGGHVLGGSLMRGLRQCALLVGGVYCLCPLLHTLAATVAHDSVVAMSVALGLAHLMLHDYNFVNIVSDRLSGALSLSAAVFAAVIVSSTMPSELHVFAQVLFSLELLLLYPFVRRYVRATSTSAHMTFTALTAVAAAAVLVPLSASPLLPIAFLALLGFVCFVCPAWLLSIQKYKARITGPWDEATPHIPKELYLPLPEGVVPLAYAGRQAPKQPRKSEAAKEEQ